MGLNSFDRNYGASQNSREYWGGNNGFVTVTVNLPAGVEIGTTAVAQDGTDAAQTALSAAQKNQFLIAQAMGQRAVLVSTSLLASNVNPAAAGYSTVGGNVLAFGSAGTPATGAFAITFVIERADVLTKQVNKPGAVYALSVDPCGDLATILAGAGMFVKSDGTDALAAAGVTVKVYDALPVIMA